MFAYNMNKTKNNIFKKNVRVFFVDFTFCKKSRYIYLDGHNFYIGLRHDTNFSIYQEKYN